MWNPVKPFPTPNSLQAVDTERNIFFLLMSHLAGANCYSQSIGNEIVLGGFGFSDP
jgi:hypothetical protein